MASTLLNAILNDEAYAANRKAPVINLTKAGFNGFTTNLKNFSANKPYVQPNLTILLVQAPLVFQLLPDRDLWVESLRSIVEDIPISIVGYQATLNTEWVSRPIGGGNEILEELVDAKRDASQIVYELPEYDGIPVELVLETMIRMRMDPETKSSVIRAISENNQVPDNNLHDQWTFVTAAFEADQTNTKVVRAWLTGNQFPKTGGEITGQRNKQNPLNMPNKQIPMTGFSQYGDGVIEYCQTRLDELNQLNPNADPSKTPAFLSNDNRDANLVGVGGYARSVVETGT